MRALVLAILTTVSSYSWASANFCTDCGGYGTPFGPEDARYTYYCFVTIEGTQVKAHKFYDDGLGPNDRNKCLKDHAKKCAAARYKHWTNIRPNPCSR